MTTVSLPAMFVPPTSDTQLEVSRQNAKLCAYPWFLTLCRAIENPLIILNEDQQVVKANRAALKFYNLQDDTCLLGATIDRQFATGAELVQENYLNYWLVTINHEYANSDRGALEKVFLHDILNTAGGIQGISEILAVATPAETPCLQNTVQQLADQLVDEITAQRDFIAAENGDLLVEAKPVNAGAVAANVAERYRNHPVTEDRQVILTNDENFTFCADPTLVSRVLGNMVKNALEASPAAGVVTIDYGRQHDKAWFSVHNPGYIPEDIQNHIFARSFSTKGRGRGLGTYGMRLLCEQFMDGKVSFTTSPDRGTAFTMTLPL